MANINVNDTQHNTVQFTRLSEDQAHKIHWASLEILERFGARLHHQPAFPIFKTSIFQGGILEDERMLTDNVPATWRIGEINPLPRDLGGKP